MTLRSCDVKSVHGSRLPFNMFFLYMRDNHKVGDCIPYVFYNKAEAVRDIYRQFAAVAD
jgi:hypothetical protein